MRMKLSSIKYFIADALKSIKRNKTISLASMATVLMTLLIFGVFLLTALNVNKGVKDIESKDQALEKFKDQLNEYQDLLSGYTKETNPLPASFLVSLEKPDYAKDVESSVKDMTGVENIGNDQDIINKISSFTNAIRWVGVVLFIILVAVSLFLIMNTIKLTVFSRRREIGIMKFVGATDWFIRWPFIIEGILIGFTGAILSTLALFFSYKALYLELSKQLITVNLVNPYYVFNTMSWEFVLGGIVIGAFGSIIALRKFLIV